MYSFPNLEAFSSMSSSNCCFLTCIQISQEAGEVFWYSHLLKNFPVCCDPHSQRLWHCRQSKSRCFSGTVVLFQWSNRCWQFDLWFLNIWKFTVHILLKPGLENFEHYFTSMWDECNCAVVWAFFGIAFLWDWNENWPIPTDCGHWWVFQICWHIECSTFTASSFRIWNSSTGIPSLPLALFVVMLSKAHLTLDSTYKGYDIIFFFLFLTYFT